MGKSSLTYLEDLLGVGNTVSFREFVSSPDFCNDPSLYEYWYEQNDQLPKVLNELILTGSLGGGKTTYGSYVLAYAVYKLFSNGSPQKQLGLSENSDIYGLYFSISLRMAQKSGFNYLYSIFENCKWFQNNCPINTELKSSIDFVGRHFHIDYASGELHQTGLNVLFFILDEANFRQGVGLGTAEQYEEVTFLYQQLLDRQLSRFARPDGTSSALAILISSASYQSSFVEKRIQAIQGNPAAKCITVTSYAANPERFSKETFEVFIGAGAVEPQIITSEDQRNRILKNANILGTGEEEKFFRKVPVNLEPSFRSNIVLALQNHCGIATNISTSFMSNLKYLYESYTEDIQPVFVSNILTASNKDDTQLEEYFIESAVQFPERPHSIFLDLSVQSDPGALVMYRYDGQANGKDLHTRVFSLTIQPPPFPEQTEITKVKNFILFLSEIYNVVAVGTDQYQSTSLRQDICKQLNIQDIRMSLDSSDVPHLLWQSALVDGRIRQTADPELEKQVREAVHDWKRHRVLKASKSKDDIMQANIGAFYLSDTVGKNYESIDDLYPEDRINLVGAHSISNLYKKLGYSDIDA